MYPVHPGQILTEGTEVLLRNMGLEGKVEMSDTAELAAATYMWLTGRNAEFLSGRLATSTWHVVFIWVCCNYLCNANIVGSLLPYGSPG